MSEANRTNKQTEITKDTKLTPLPPFFFGAASGLPGRGVPGGGQPARTRRPGATNSFAKRVLPPVKKSVLNSQALSCFNPR